MIDGPRAKPAWMNAARRGPRRRHLVSLLLIALVLTLAPAGVAAWLQATDASPATGDAQVVAHGVLTIPAGDLVWQIERQVAPPPATAEQIAPSSGFLLGAEGAVLIEDVPTGEQVRLAPGEAVLTQPGAAQIRAAIGANAATYYAISLATADAVPGPGELVFASEPFAGLDGRYEVDLVRDVLAASGTLDLPAGTGPTLLFVTAGAADITLGTGEVVSLGADQAIALSGPLALTGGAEGAVVQAAVTGPAVPRLTGPDTAAPTAPAATVPAASPVAAVSPTGAPTVPVGTPIAPVPAEPVPTGAAVTEPAPTDAAPAPTAPVAEPTTATTEGTDTDGDGLTDATEAEINADPAAVDTDGDGLTDGEEVLTHGTAPLAPDTDGDGVLDGDEVNQGSDPLSAGTAPDTAGDSDGDVLPYAIEALLGTDPADTDTDDDGLTDGDEYYTYQTGTRNPDNDGDGVLDGAEIENGTDPNDPNSF